MNQDQHENTLLTLIRNTFYPSKSAIASHDVDPCLITCPPVTRERNAGWRISFSDLNMAEMAYRNSPFNEGWSHGTTEKAVLSDVMTLTHDDAAIFFAKLFMGALTQPDSLFKMTGYPHFNGVLLRDICRHVDAYIKREFEVFEKTVSIQPPYRIDVKREHEGSIYALAESAVAELICRIGMGERRMLFPNSLEPLIVIHPYFFDVIGKARQSDFVIDMRNIQEPTPLTEKAESGIVDAGPVTGVYFTPTDMGDVTLHLVRSADDTLAVSVNGAFVGSVNLKTIRPEALIISEDNEESEDDSMHSEAIDITNDQKVESGSVMDITKKFLR